MIKPNTRAILRIGVMLGTSMVAFAPSTLIAQVEGQSGDASANDVPAGAGVPEADALGSVDIIVTARKRSETVSSVPASIVALDKAALDRYRTNDLPALASQIPGLIINPMASGSGGSVSIRGVTSPPQNPSADQGVSFVLDGVQVGSVNIARLAQVDLQQVEVLKGPQALFFGKNSPGGVISLRSADPSDRLFVRGVVGYETEAQEKTGELVVSGPLSDTFGLRGVVYYSGMNGYQYNRSPTLTSSTTPGGTYAFAPRYKRDPHRDQIFTRLTALYSPSEDFQARLKYSYARVTGASAVSDSDRIYCPYGAPQITPSAAAVDDCKMDNIHYRGGSDPRAIQQYSEFFPDPDGLKSRQHLGSAELSYNVAPGIALTSVSGIYSLREAYYDQFSYQPQALVISGQDTRRREVSQEIRLATDRSDWPVNFTVGAYYQNSKFFTQNPLVINTPSLGTSTLAAVNVFRIKSDAFSAFGQLLWNITPKLELSGGARYSREERHLVFSQFAGTPGSYAEVVRPTARPDLTFNDVSPEVSLRWRPAPRLTFFGAFRNGFKSGGFNTGLGPAPGRDLTYKPEDVRGFEAGMKAGYGDLSFNITAYRYAYKNLQVVSYDPINLRQSVFNAASSRIQGLEFDATLRPSGLRGFELKAALNYNHARYTEFFASCYTGQTIAEGCNIGPTIGVGTVADPARFTRQDLGGAQLNLAPDWTGNLGAAYTFTVGSGLKASLGGDTNYSSSFFSQLEEAPFVRQKSYWKFNANVRIGAEDDRWTLALIAKNLSSVYRSGYTSQVGLSGIATRTGTATPGGLSDYNGVINRGREVRAELSVQF